tara:strand:+ start:57 stop:251 length:195 start_codon:yes stop_codon:yes gene_type:complete
MVRVMPIPSIIIPKASGRNTAVKKLLSIAIISLKVGILKGNAKMRSMDRKSVAQISSQILRIKE